MPARVERPQCASIWPGGCCSGRWCVGEFACVSGCLQTASVSAAFDSLSASVGGANSVLHVRPREQEHQHQSRMGVIRIRVRVGTWQILSHSLAHTRLSTTGIHTNQYQIRSPGPSPTSQTIPSSRHRASSVCPSQSHFEQRTQPRRRRLPLPSPSPRAHPRWKRDRCKMPFRQTSADGAGSPNPSVETG